MIKKISRSAGLVFSDECAGLVSAACSDMPYWVRKACSYIHRQVDISVRPHVLSLDQTRDFIRSFVDTEGAVIAQVAIRHLFRVYPELEGPALKYSINGDRNITKIQHTVLSNYGVLLGPPDHSLSGQMLRQGLLLCLDKNIEDASANVSAPASPEPNSLSDWADDLAVINKERNLLEKRLRQVVLNFIRADAAAKRSTLKVSVKERIEAVLPADRKSKLTYVTADELIEKLLWSELVALIRREWGLFQNTLGDKKQFELQSTLINDRFDAHAKDFDAADFALYRRALKWVNERIASL